MSTLGFRMRGRDDFADLTMHAVTAGKATEISDGSAYRVWSPGEGIELWAQLDPHGRIIGLNPHFSGQARMQVRITQRVARPLDNALDGAFYGWAGASIDGPGSGDYPFVFDAPDFRAYDALRLPAIVSVQLAAFAHSLTAYPDDQTFHEHGTESDMRMAAESCIPSGTFSDPPKSEILFYGHVLKTATLTNPFSALSFHWALVRTLGGDVDVIADPEIVKGMIVEHGVVGGVAWISGRVKSVVGQVGTSDRKLRGLGEEQPSDSIAEFQRPPAGLDQPPK
jgi:hypothetical protein